MHLAHVTGWGHAEIMDMPLEELNWWCRQAADYWDRLNTPADVTDG